MILSAEANGDLDAIYIETFERWGEQQAEKYLSQLGRAFEQLGQHPRSG